MYQTKFDIYMDKISYTFYCTKEKENQRSNLQLISEEYNLYVSQSWAADNNSIKTINRLGKIQ